MNRSAVWGLGSACLVLILVGLLYLATLDNGLRPGELTGGDLITHQYAQVLARPSNAPGYPLYTLGGWAWFQSLRAILPQASPISLLGSFSTLWALLALTVLFVLLAQITRRNWLLTSLVTLLYAVSYFFWYYAVTTEQYTSAVLQTLLFVWLAWTWDARQGNTAPPGTRYRLSADHLLLLMALLAGIALAHLVTVLAILPPLVWFVLTRQPGLLRQPRRLLILLIVTLLPLLSYLFIYVRGAQHPEWRGAGEWANTWDWFWSFVSTGQGRSELTWSLRPLWTAEWPALLWRELTVVGTVVGVFGWIRLGRRGVLLAATSIIYVLFSFVDRLGNWYQVVMPVYAMLALGIGAAADAVWRWAAAGTPGNTRRQALVRGLLVVTLAGLIVFQLAQNFPHADQSNRPEDRALLPGWAVLASEPPAGAAILATQPEADALRYLGTVGGVRPDMQPITTAQARTRLAADQPVYVTPDAAPLVVQEVLAAPHWRAVAPGLLQVLPAPAIDDLNGQARPLGDGLTLRDASIQWAPLPPAAPWRDPAQAPSAPGLDVRLTWQVSQTPQHDWSISLRPTIQGQPLRVDGVPVQMDVQHPVYGQYPTGQWSPGERVDEIYRLVIPAGAAVDGVTVVVYRRLADGSFENLGEEGVGSTE